MWSFGDQLTGSVTRHWTGAPQPLTGLIRIDGTAYRFAGVEPSKLQPLEQTSLKITPTSTRYEFAGAGVRLALTFLTPALANDLDLLSRPVTYVRFEVHSTDASPHEVQLEFDASAQLAVNTPDQRVNVGRYEFGTVTALRAAAAEQKVLARTGDNLRIEWGSLYLAPADRGIGAWGSTVFPLCTESQRCASPKAGVYLKTLCGTPGVGGAGRGVNSLARFG